MIAKTNDLSIFFKRIPGLSVNDHNVRRLEMMNYKKLLYGLMGLLLVSVLFVRGCDFKRSSEPTININNVFEKDNLIPIVIIGSGPSGLAAAIYGVWANIKVMVINGPTKGGLLTETTYVENWPGKKSALGPDIMASLEDQVASLSEKVAKNGPNSLIFLNDTVSSIDFSSWPYQLHTEDGKSIYAMSIILATGASPKRLGIPSEGEYWKKGVTTCAVCDGGMYPDKPVVVIGGGDSAAEEAMQLARIAKTVTVLVRKDKMRASPPMQARLAEQKNVRVIYNVEVTQILGNGNAVTGVEIENATNKEKQVIQAEGVFLAIGHTPNSALVKDHIKTNDQGYLIMKERSQETSMPGVFAAGEVEDWQYRQAGVAAGNGIKAGLDAIKFLNEIGFNSGIAQKIEARYFKETKTAQVGHEISVITSEAEFKKEVMDYQGIVVADYFKEDCGPCQKLAPIFKEVAAKFGNKAKFVKVDSQPALSVALKYHIQSLPTIIIYNKGKLAARYQGLLSENDLIKLIERVLEGDTDLARQASFEAGQKSDENEDVALAAAAAA